MLWFLLLVRICSHSSGSLGFGCLALGPEVTNEPCMALNNAPQIHLQLQGWWNGVHQDVVLGLEYQHEVRCS